MCDDHQSYDCTFTFDRQSLTTANSHQYHDPSIDQLMKDQPATDESLAKSFGYGINNDQTSSRLIFFNGSLLDQSSWLEIDHWSTIGFWMLVGSMGPRRGKVNMGRFGWLDTAWCEFGQWCLPAGALPVVQVCVTSGTFVSRLVGYIHNWHPMGTSSRLVMMVSEYSMDLPSKSCRFVSTYGPHASQ